MQEVITQLHRLRHRAWLALVLQRLAVILSGTLLLLAALVALDFGLRLPSGVRLVLLVLGVAGLGYGVWSYLGMAVRFHPSVTQLALRIEQALPRVAGRLASSVEFAMAGVDQRNPMAARSVRETRSRLAGESVTSIMKLRRTGRDIGLLVVIVAAVTAAIIAQPALAKTGLSRVLLPLGDARWPARTGVASLMDDVLPASGVHPRGQSLVLRAQVTKGADQQRVNAHFRFRRPEGLQPWREIVLTHQGEGVHERLIDTNAEGVEIYFSTADDATETRQVILVPPPAVTRATLTVTPPPYAAPHAAPFEQEMGPGLDQRSVTERPSLVGSAVALGLVLNKPLPVPQDEASRARWLRRTLGWEDPGDPPILEVDDQAPQQWTLRWTLQGQRSLWLDLVDEHELRNGEPITYRIDAVDDHSPAVTMLEPSADQAVLPTAMVPLVAEATDDVAITTMALEASRADAGPDVAPAWAQEKDVNALSGRIEADLDLAPFQLTEGDVVVVQSTARDNFQLDGSRHEAARSVPRRLRIISELDFASHLRRQLGAVRQNAIRIEASQGELQDDLIDDGLQPGLDRGQAQVGERIAAQGQALVEVGQQMRTNRLDDQPLADLLQQAGDLMDFAGRAANRAVEAMEARQAEGPRPREQTPPDEDGLREPAEADRPIVDAQQEVRDELADLIELLDRDEDTWVVTRQLEMMLEQQARLQGETGQLNERTIGRDPSDLGEAEQSEMQRIADAQRELAEDARRQIDELRERAEAMEEVDPDSAAGMRTAADTGEQRELDRTMDSASQRVGENQLQNAMAQQQVAQDTLKRMLEEIEESKRARAEQLLRRLASLIESIQRLIVVQENELAALAAAVADEDFTGRDRAMIRLNQNTQAVAGEARASGQQARRIARTLDRAADSQGAAIVALRAAPLDAGAAGVAEERSLELLKEAKALAEELQEQTEEEQVRRRREELMEAYRAFAERQVTIRAAALELAEAGELDRRQVVEARRLATDQDEVGAGLADLRKSSQELMEAAMFSLVHRRIDAWSAQASAELRETRVGPEVTDRQQWIARSIGRLIEALEEALTPPEEFAGEQDAGGGGQGQSGQQPLIPPVAELRLLQGLQEELYDQTRDLDNREDLAEAQRRQRLRDLGEHQRELMELGEDMVERIQPPPPPDDEEGGGPTDDEGTGPEPDRGAP